MAKVKTNKAAKVSNNRLHFSETYLVIFAMAFATVASYTWLQSFAAPHDASYMAQTYVSAEEKAWFSSITGASAIILISGPVAALILWWIWRRSSFAFWAKLLMTVTPLLIVMRFT